MKLEIQNHLKRGQQQFKVHYPEITQASAALAYTTILSLIPLLAVSFTVFKAFGGLDKLFDVIEPFVMENLTEGINDEAVALIKKMISNVHTDVIGIGGFIGLIITSMSLLNSVEKSINKIWRVTTSRPLFTRLTLYWFFITLGPIAFSVLLGARSSQMSFLTLLPSGSSLYLIFIIGFFSLYKLVPNRKVNWIAALVSALYTASVWMIAKVAFGYYTSKVLTYSTIYGSLGAIPILLLWIYINWVVILSGAAIGSSLQQKYDLKE